MVPTSWAGSSRMSASVSRREMTGARRRPPGHRRLMGFRSRQNLIVCGRLIFKVIWLHVIAAHGVILESFPHQQPPQVWMPLKNNAEQIKSLTLLKFRASPNGSIEEQSPNRRVEVVVRTTEG